MSDLAIGLLILWVIRVVIDRNCNHFIAGRQAILNISWMRGFLGPLTYDLGRRILSLLAWHPMVVVFLLAWLPERTVPF